MTSDYTGKTKCPSCGLRESGVVDSRPSFFREIPAVQRKRVCEFCGARYATFEITLQDLTRIERETLLRAAKIIESMGGEY